MFGPFEKQYDGARLAILQDISYLIQSCMENIKSGFRACEINPLYSMAISDYAYLQHEPCYRILKSEEVVIDNCFLDKKKEIRELKKTENKLEKYVHILIVRKLRISVVS